MENETKADLNDSFILLMGNVTKVEEPKDKYMRHQLEKVSGDKFNK
jgi:hypothetical protein